MLYMVTSSLKGLSIVEALSLLILEVSPTTLRRTAIHRNELDYKLNSIKKSKIFLVNMKKVEIYRGIIRIFTFRERG